SRRWARPAVPPTATPACARLRCCRATRPGMARPQPLNASSRGWSMAAAGACLLPLLLQLPGSVALGIGGLGLLVVALSWRLQVPSWLRLLLAPALLGLVLANYGFHFGRDTGCALLAAMLAIKP